MLYFIQNNFIKNDLNKNKMGDKEYVHRKRKRTCIFKGIL